MLSMARQPHGYVEHELRSLLYRQFIYRMGKFNNNLPNVMINELEINYADNRLYAATSGTRNCVMLHFDKL